MKNVFIVSMVVSFAMICSCQKQDLAAEQQLAQRKVELDAREDALIEREKVADERKKALDEREKALAENQKSTTDPRAIPPDVKSQSASRDPAQLKAERDKIIQQVSAEMRALIPDDSKMKAQREREKLERSAQKQPGLEKLQRQKQRVLEMSGAAVAPAVETASPPPSAAPEAASATPSPTPQ
jgi:uncharacterized protein (DUF3084 family)